MIVVLGQFEVHPEDAQDATNLMRTMAADTAKEPGCAHYAFAVDLCAPHRFQLSEWWHDDAALAAHFRTSHMATFRSAMAKLRVQRRVVKKFEVAGVEDL